ncbi:MAG: ABC transporter permease [Pseudomonadota bacterium]|nr:ABC transporter permease [Pseudomonadota bacterium]
MNRFAIMVRQTLTIARRDFVATVFTPTFLIFLFAPVIMGSFGAIGGLEASAAAGGAGDKDRIVAIVAGDAARDMVAVDARLRRVFREPGDAPPMLQTEAPAADPASQARALIDDKDIAVPAVLYGPLDRPQILYAIKGERTANYLAQLAEETLRAARSGGGDALSTATMTSVSRSTPAMSRGHESGFFAVFALFFLTLLLAGQVVSGIAEERGNKVIEILAAAVPLESVFFGKLIGTFGVAATFLLFWGTLLTQVASLMPAGMAAGLHSLTPAMGMPLFTLLFFAYFTMAYMLLGSVFLSVGAQASTVREIQLLSLPITIVNVSMFGLSAVAVSQPHSWIAAFAQIFPLSSPFAMAGRAAQSPELWPNLAALAWQALWVTIFIAIGVRAFRRGVLQSGSGKSWFRALFRRA